METGHVILIVVKFPVRHEVVDGFLPLVADFTEATRGEPGNISFEWSRSAEDPDTWVLVEVFRDAAAGAAHVATDHFKAAIAHLPSLLTGTPRIIHADIPGDGWSRMAELDADPA